jgi:hypothetical protein
MFVCEVLMCMCVCVCVRERKEVYLSVYEREKETKRDCVGCKFVKSVREIER